MIEWIDIPGFCYQISDDCKLVRRTSDRYTKLPKIIDGTIDEQGYTWYMLPYSKKRLRLGLHHLSYRTFIESDFLPSREIVVDHKDNDQSNNHHSNLQKIKQRLNTVKDKYGKRSSKYVGVCVVNATGKWTAQINHKKIKYHLGTFDTEYEAYLAYCNKLEELTGIKLKKDI